jgi:hypothetical protein
MKTWQRREIRVREWSESGTSNCGWMAENVDCGREIPASQCPSSAIASQTTGQTPLILRRATIVHQTYHVS